MGQTTIRTAQLNTPIPITSKLIGGVMHNQLWIAGWKPTKTSGCADSAQLELGTNKTVFDYLAFDTSAVENAYANIVMPQDYTGGVLYHKYYWTHPATTVNFGVYFKVGGVSFSNDDTLDAAQGTLIGVVDTGGTTSDLYISDLSSPITLGGSPVAGDLVQFGVQRLGSNAGDTLAVDAYLLGVLLWYPVA